MPVTDGEGNPAQDRTRQAMLIAGGCSFALGVATLVWPGRSDATLALLFGVALLLSAGIQAYLAVAAHMAFPLRVLVLVSAVLTVILAALAFSGGNIELLALWIGIGWSVRGIVQALVAAWDDGVVDGWLHEICGLCTTAMGITVIAMKFETVTGLATVAGSALVVIGVLEQLAGGMLRTVLRGARRSQPDPTTVRRSAAAGQ
ncbi:hypothetical protein ATM97_31690 [Nocardia sp. MH4]|uniref:DUF308 domain-containing protein n=1 Tax=Nocardia sp. MH4 TaxID=1768677 RepID=UPI001C4E8A85|nr:DUF308 domain-containing protein [Nocardia sp. MH4]MBW0273877.1 hypothetical protein [Nocardia sp. MH4]